MRKYILSYPFQGIFFMEEKLCIAKFTNIIQNERNMTIITIDFSGNYFVNYHGTNFFESRKIEIFDRERKFAH
jgi:hypothetical protein